MKKKVPTLIDSSSMLSQILTPLTEVDTQLSKIQETIDAGLNPRITQSFVAIRNELARVYKMASTQGVYVYAEAVLHYYQLECFRDRNSRDYYFVESTKDLHNYRDNNAFIDALLESGEIKPAVASMVLDVLEIEPEVYAEAVAAKEAEDHSRTTEALETLKTIANFFQ